MPPTRISRVRHSPGSEASPSPRPVRQPRVPPRWTLTGASSSLFVWDPRVERGVFCLQSRRISVFPAPGYPAAWFTAERSLLWSSQV